MYYVRTKHIELDVHFIRNLITDHKIEVRYVPTEEQPADILTKALLQERFALLCAKLTMIESTLSLRGPVNASNTAPAPRRDNNNTHPSAKN